MSSSKASVSNLFTLPISSFEYRQTSVAHAVVPATTATGSIAVEAHAAEGELVAKLAAEYARGVAETETRLRQEYERRNISESSRISDALASFIKTRNEYFAKVELEVVELALAIAAKILHREAQVDPMLMAALVQIALVQMKEGSRVSIRVRPEKAERWRDHFGSAMLKLTVTVVEDGDLAMDDCVLETDLGTGNFSLDVQLKEVQQGFFDVLARTPKA